MIKTAKPSQRERLRRLGVSDRQCEWLLRNYDLRVIELQLDWLPFRSPRKPASMIVSAIRFDYDRPSILEGLSDSNDSSGNSDDSPNNSSEFSPIPELGKEKR